MNKQSSTSAQRPRLTLMASVVLAVTLSACSSMAPPEALKAAEVDKVNQADKAAMREQVEPITGPITLDEAMARALKYNLARRSHMLEEALSLRQYEAGRFDMLPKLTAQWQYAHRSNDRISQSLDPVTGDISTTGFISQERNHSMSDLGATWSLLDFGVGYYNNRQQSNRVLVAIEKRRRAMHMLMQDVRTAYWRAASAQVLRERVVQTIQLGEEALADSRQVEQERVRNPLDALRYQRQLLESLRLLESINQELLSAQVDLASLINAPLGTTIEVAATDVPMDLDRLTQWPVEQLEELALRNNPELREQHLMARIAADETRKVIARMFPNLTFNYSINYDTDKFLVNQHWNQAGLQLSFNFMNLLSGPAQMKMADAGVALADQRRMATQMAVLTQVHLARLQLANARQQFDRAEQVLDTDRRINDLLNARAKVQAASKLEEVSQSTSAILSLLRRYQALAQVHTAASRLMAQIGIEPDIGSTDDLTLEELKEKLKPLPKEPIQSINFDLEMKLSTSKVPT